MSIWGKGTQSTPKSPVTEGQFSLLRRHICHKRTTYGHLWTTGRTSALQHVCKLHQWDMAAADSSDDHCGNTGAAHMHADCHSRASEWPCTAVVCQTESSTCMSPWHSCEYKECWRMRQLDGHQLCRRVAFCFFAHFVFLIFFGYCETDCQYWYKWLLRKTPIRNGILCCIGWNATFHCAYTHFCVHVCITVYCMYVCVVL